MKSSRAMVALVAALCLAGAARGDEPPPPPPAPAPPTTPSPEREAALKQAAELDEQGARLYGQGKYAQALPLVRKCLELREQALGAEHPEVAGTVSNLADTLRAVAAFGEARALYERAISIHEKALGKEDPKVAYVLNNLAGLLLEQGAHAASRAHFERALAIYEKALGRDDPGVAKSLNGLALLLQDQGAHAAARPLLERALSILERALGKDHPRVASCLGNLGLLLQDQGALADAKPLFERALAISKQALGEEHPTVAVRLNNLAGLARARGDYAEAKALYERALAIKEQALGKSHPDVALSLSNLAGILQIQRAFAEARPLLGRALSINQSVFGEDHPAVARDVNNLAGLLTDQKDYAAAQPLYERALAIRERAWGSDHPEVAASANNVAGVLQAQGAYEQAKPFFERALAIVERRVREDLVGLSAPQRMARQRSVRVYLDNWLVISPRVGSSGYAEVLRFRGLVARAEAAERVLSRRTTGEDRDLVERLQGAQRLVAQLVNRIPPVAMAEARARWQERYATAAADKERLTVELARRIAPLRNALERLDLRLPDIQARLGPDTALVEFLRVRSWYFAWIVRGTGEPVRVELGSAEPIEAACAAFVAAISTSDTGEGGAALRALVWEPIEKRLGEGVQRVVLCPDLALAAVPFAALPGQGPGRSLLDDYSLAYVSQAQDLVPWKDSPSPRVGALLVGGVDYEHAAAPPAPATPQAGPALAVRDGAPRGVTFRPIPQTQVEVEDLEGRLGAGLATVLLGREATESRVRAEGKGRHLLHIATHGFAREDLLRGLHERQVKDAWLSADAERQLSAGHDPMLLSGLALAGANPRDGAGGDDGILTALEASYLDLDGVHLVTLSACETARGTPESGEGVQGLVRAFQMAGARRVVASLWRVSDEATRLLMDGFYERILRKENPLSPEQALREASLALRNAADANGKVRFAAPRFWAAFVAYGG